MNENKKKTLEEKLRDHYNEMFGSEKDELLFKISKQLVETNHLLEMVNESIHGVSEDIYEYRPQ